MVHMVHKQKFARKANIFDKEHDFMGGWGIVGGHVPLANGVGWAIKQRKEERVCVCFFGDGAMHQGAFFEALCLALRVSPDLSNNP